MLSKKQRENEHEFNESQTVKQESLTIFCSLPQRTTFPRIPCRQDSGSDASKERFSLRIWKAKRSHFSPVSNRGLVTRGSPYPIKKQCVAVTASCTFRFLGRHQFPPNLPECVVGVQASNSLY